MVSKEAWVRMLDYTSFVEQDIVDNIGILSLGEQMGEMLWIFTEVTN